MKLAGIIFSSISLLLSTYGLDKSPNFLFIFADDMAYETINAYGLTDIDTPNLDRLVKSGTSFSRAYNMGAWDGAVCIASRTMLMTGKTVWNAYVMDSKKSMAEAANAGSLWPQYLQQNGYNTYMSGKWHIKNNPTNVFNKAIDVKPGMPNDVLDGYNRPFNEEDYESGWKPWDVNYGGFWEGGIHWSEVLANNGIDFLTDASTNNSPFFMYLAFNAPHDPRQSPQSFVDRYPLDRIKVPANFVPKYKYEEEMGCGPAVRDERLAPFPRNEYSVKVNRQEYYALITHMDEQIGRILEVLDKTGLADSTYVIFTADHGLSVGHHGLIGKQNLYEHSTQVPFIIKGPDIKSDHTINTPIYLQDIMPTTLELAEVDIPSSVEFKSLVPLIRETNKNHYDFIYGGFRGLQRSITDGEWKLIHYTNGNINRLYNITKDPNEMTDLALDKKYRKNLNDLKSKLVDLSQRLNDPIDYDNPIDSWEKK